MKSASKRRANVAAKIVATVFFLVPLTAVAQASNASNAAGASDNKANVERLLGNPQVRQMLLDTARQSAVMVNNPCAEAGFALDGNRIAILKSLQLDDSGNLTSGAWQQPVKETGCGSSHLLNVLAFAKADKSLGSAPGLPGTSRANPLLQQDSLKVAYSVAALAAGEPNATCKTQYVADIEYVGEEGDALEGVQGRPWREIWTVASCSKRSTVPILFIPDKTGTSFRVGMEAVKISPLN